MGTSVCGSLRVKERIHEECQDVWEKVSIKDDSGGEVKILKGDNYGEIEKRVLYE